jgi:hypothetical protein
MKNNFFVRIISLTSVDIMAEIKCSNDNEEGLRNLVESVLDSDNECSDFCKDETESEESSSGNDDESSEENREESDEKDDDANPSKCVRTTMQKEYSDWKWTKTDNNPLIYHFTENSRVCDDLSKFEAEPPSELSIF